MKKLIVVLLPILLLITLGCWTLFEFESGRKVPTLPIEMVAFNSLTPEEESLILASPKDSNVEKIAVTDQIKPLINKDYTKEKIFKITFNHTAIESQGNLIVFVDTNKKTVVGKEFDGETLATLK